MARTFVLLAAVGFGTTGTAQALGPDASPLTVGAMRIAIGAALLLLVARATAGGLRRTAVWDRRAVAAGEVATLTLAEPVLTAAVLGAVVLGERPAGLAVAGIVVVLAGLAVLAAPRAARAPVVAARAAA